MRGVLHYYHYDNGFKILCKEKSKYGLKALGEDSFKENKKYRKCQRCLKKMKGTKLEKYVPSPPIAKGQGECG